MGGALLTPSLCAWCRLRWLQSHLLPFWCSFLCIFSPLNISLTISHHLSHLTSSTCLFFFESPFDGPFEGPFEVSTFKPSEGIFEGCRPLKVSLKVPSKWDVVEILAGHRVGREGQCGTIQEDSCQELASVVMEKIYTEEISMEVQLKEWVGPVLEVWLWLESHHLEGVVFQWMC